MSKLQIIPSEWEKYIGKELGTSDWYLVTQDEIMEYGNVVGDMQWIHTDPERAKKESPYGGTIAHGNWIISIIHTKLLMQIYTPIKTRMIINYGWNKIRFPAPTPVGKRIRLKAKVIDVLNVSNNAVQIEIEYKVYVEGEDKSCCVAIKVTRNYS
ncbi:MAG: MaoC family dehydratase [Promethearchaeota archaeon]